MKFLLTTESLAALLSTAFISLAPNLVLFLFPQSLSTSNGNQKIWSYGQALAAGGLLGDVFLHTLPHSMMISSHQDQPGIWILVGFTFFLVTDILLRSMNHHHHDEHDEKGNEHHPSSDRTTASTNRSTIVLNLVADSLHNFTDGLAIGASYAVGSSQKIASSIAPATVWSLIASRGGWATLSILFHELPHELGDLSTLVKAGYTVRQAIWTQFTTAIAAFLGTLIALFVSHDQRQHSDSNNILLLVTAGGFIYLASANILPEVLHEKCHWSDRLYQLFAFVVGIGFMYAVSLLEEEGHDHHHQGGHSHHHHHHSLDDTDCEAVLHTHAEL